MRHTTHGTTTTGSSPARDADRRRHRRGRTSVLVVALVASLGWGATGAGAADSKSDNAPGVTADEVKIGIWIGSGGDTGHAESGTGVSELAASGNTIQDIYQLKINDINDRGGLFGKKVVPVFFYFDSSSTTPVAVQDEAACAKFTQDNEVFAALIGPYHTDTLLSCLEKAGVLTFQTPGFALVDEKTVSKFKHFVLAGALTTDNMFKALVAGASEDKFFSKGSKVGLVTYDTPDYQRAVKKTLEPALKKAKAKLVDQVAVAPLTSAAALADATPVVASAILRFKAAGIDKVLLLGSSGLGFPLLNALGAQDYHPQLAMTSADTPYFLSISNVPTEVLKGAVGVGWQPAADITDAPTNSVGQECIDSLTPKGIPAATAKLQGLGVCDHMSLFEAAVVKGGSLDRDAIVKALPKLGEIQLASNDLNHFGSKRSAAPRYARLAYESSCKCFQYTSELADG
jgi:ABC-type branched-subunit amino acid transport system substrate-binding protein